MKKNQGEAAIENHRLEQTIALAKRQLKEAILENEENSSEILSLKRELRENTVHSIAGLWNPQNFEDLVELSQFTEPITMKLASHEATAKKIAILERLIDSPYFARIDFKYDGENIPEKIYIGRASLLEYDSYKMVVYDWRSPIASVFYRFGLGQAFFEAPAGRITGEVELKRQYEIKKGRLDYFFDADVQIMDEFLRKMLAQNTSAHMKTIVETIQKEQDIVIRDMENDLMMVQGVAGSGKTSIALHRAAYLMYQGLSTKLGSNNIIIISPNVLFAQYISKVLPELGEDNVVSVVFEEILAEILPNKRLQTRNQFLERLITSPQSRDIIKSSIAFKTSRLFGQILERFVSGLPKQNPTEMEVKNLYQQLFSDKRYFQGFDLPANIKDIWGFTQKNLCASFIHYDDAAALAFMQLKLSKSTPYKNIKQVVIDEAQDYYPLHYEIFNLLFARAKYTVLGDINQTLEKQENLSLYAQIGEIMNRERSSLVTMDKSFRCTNEILSYSAKFIPRRVEIQSFNRSGSKPQVYVAESLPALNEKLIAEVESCLAEGYRSVGLICKTEKNAVTLFEHLKDRLDVQLIKHESSADLQGVFIIPVYMSKGLEFDAVLICDTDKENYHSEEDKKLLYIACTRALHRLNLFCKEEVSPLL